MLADAVLPGMASHVVSEQQGDVCKFECERLRSAVSLL